MTNSDESRCRPISGIRAAARFLLPAPPARVPHLAGWERGSFWFLAIGLLIGASYAVLYSVSWRLFGEYEYIRWMPAATVLIADLGLGGYRLVSSAAALGSENFSNDQATSGVMPPGLIAVVLVAVFKLAVLLSLPRGIWPSEGMSDLGQFLHRRGWESCWPNAVLRPLILMPIWGRWAMMLALTIGQSAPGASTRLSVMARGTRLSQVAAFWLVLVALTGLLSTGSWSQVGTTAIISLGVFLAAYIVSFVSARRVKGQTEATVGLAGLVGELAFLALFHGFVSRMYWY